MSKGIINSCKCRQNRFRLAEDDIICYKIIRKGNSITECPKGLYIDEHYSDFIYQDTLIEAKKEKIKNNWFKRYILRKPKYSYLDERIEYNEEYNWWDITSGYLHSTPHKIDKDNFYNYLPWFLPKDTVIQVWQCIIPKGTKYYQADCRGSHFESSDSYASKKLIFRGLIFEKKIDIMKAGGAKY